MKILCEMCLVFCVIFALYWQCIECGFRRGASRGRVTQTYKSRGTNSNSGSSGGGLFSWFRGGSSSNKNNAVTSARTKTALPPSLSHRDRVAQSPSHIGFAAYGNNYESNFHHNRLNHNQFRPMSHPYQSHFQPQTTAVFAYHFMPSTHVNHIHYVGDGSSSINNSTYTASHEPFFYDYRKSNTSATTSVKEPIIYDYKPPSSYVNETSSEEDEPNVFPTNPDDVLIAGVENLLFYGDMKENQHQVVFITQDSDGITFENELLSKLNRFESDDNDEAFYFPDVEFRFDADDEPNNEDLDNIFEMYKKLIDDGRC